MTWWQAIIAVSICCVYVTNAGVISGKVECNVVVKWTNGTELLLDPKPKSIDDICFTPECIHAASWIQTDSKFTVDPCDDFYEFTCGNVNLAKIPDDQYVRSEIDLAEDKLLVRLKSLIEGIDKAKVPKHFGLLKTLYDNCMNAVQGNMYSDSQLGAVYTQLHAANGWPVLLGNNWNGPEFAVKSNFLAIFLEMSFVTDPKDSTKSVPYLAAKEHSLDSEILRMGFDNDIVQAYYALMVKTAVLFRATQAQAESEIKEALLLGIDIAKCAPSVAKKNIATERWTRTTVGEFLKKFSKLNFRSFIFLSIAASYNLTDNDVIVVEGDFDKFEKVLSNVSERVLANWVIWLNIFPKLSTLAPQLHAEVKDFQNYRIGRVEESSKWKKCVMTVRSELGLSLSALYQRTYMSQNIVSDLAEMVSNTKQQLIQLVTQSDLLDKEAKEEYRQKIDDMITQVSYRDEYVDDKKLEEFYEKVELVDGLLSDSLTNISVGTLKAPARNRANPNVRGNWVDYGNILADKAQYLQFVNLLRIGASLTLKNMYHIDRPKYVNYGTLGFIIAHEMGHSLDTLGIHIDKQRNVREWWSPETKQKYDDRVQCIINQYGNYTVEELGVKLNGPRHAFENIADNVGLKLAYQTYLHWAGQHIKEKELPGLPYTPKQMFWITMASSWCTKVEKPGLRDWITRDSHTPAKQRVNGALANSPEFADDFKCKSGTKMHPVKKCSIL